MATQTEYLVATPAAVEAITPGATARQWFMPEGIYLNEGTASGGGGGGSTDNAVIVFMM